MNLTQYLELMFNDCSNPCVFVDYDTDELVYINQATEKKFQLFDDYSGKTATSIFKEYLQSEDLPQNKEVKEKKFVSKRVYCKPLGKFLRSNTTLLPDLYGRNLLMTKYFMTSTDKKRADAETSFETAMTQCLEILALPDQTTSIKAFMKLLCDFYSCELAYICEFDSDQTTLASKYFWNKSDGETGIPLERRDTVSLGHFVSWLENNNNRDIISIERTAAGYEKNSTEGQILDKYGSDNITLNKLWNKDGSVMGIVGMSNRSAPIYDDRLLKAVSHFVVERFNEASMIKALESLNEIDLLTGFYNRSKYAQKLREIHENPPKTLGVLFVNLNGLRRTNEYFGFEVGDVQIKQTASILREFISEEFYRISGDEFVGFISNCEKTAFEEKVDELQVLLKAEHHETTFSLGHSWGSGAYSISELVKVADTVMVINKQAFYSNTFNENDELSNSMLNDLFRGIAEDEFLVYLQPQINLETEEVIGAEALIRRFDKKQNKMIFPDQFVSLYEKNSIIRHVDLFVIRKVCQILVEWGHFERQLPISVNLSRVTLMEHGIVTTITEILDEYDVPHSLIIIEVTERIGLIENEVASSLVDEFKENGFKLSLDDFGCAYSNIVTLATISVDEVKIDKSLVDHVLTNPKNSVIVKNMLAMCLEFENTHTLAEGIETQEQADFLRSVKCQLGQGYLYSRPIPNEDFFLKYIKGHMDGDTVHKEIKV